MVNNLLKRVGFIGLALLTLSITAFNLFVFKQTVSAASTLDWVDGEGKVIKGESGGWEGRLQFLSPRDIYDSKTKTTYTTKDKIFSSESKNLIKEADGWYIFLPTGKSNNYVAPDNAHCYGVFIWYLTGNGKISHLELAQPDISSGKGGCSIQGKSLSEPTNTSIDPKGTSLRIISDGDWGKYAGKADWLVAPMYWASKDQVSYFESSNSLTRVTKGDTTYDQITRLIGSKANEMKSQSSSEFEYWRMGTCTKEYLVTELIGTKVSGYGYILHFNGDPTKGEGSPSGTEYFDIGGNGGSNCMTGRNVTGPSYNLINYDSSPAGRKHQVPIAYAPQINDPSANPVVAPPLSSSTSDNGVLEESCYTSGGVFAFILCPILDAIDKLTSWAEGVIADQLVVDLGSKQDRQLLQDTWTKMAKIASIFLVLIALVMVISTALGLSFFDAYTIKKVIPRLAIGAVGIAFSWALVTYYIDFINAVGKELASIMLSQFADAKDFSLTTIGAAAINGGGNKAGFLFTGISMIAIGVVGWLGILGLALTAGLAFVVALATLAVRKAIIIFLVILSPLAIAAWILPNTQKLWKKWSSTLNQLLLMYPMIMGLLAAGKIFAMISTQTATGKEKGSIDNFLGIAISIIAYIAPLFMIPGLLKASSGILGKISTGLSKQAGKVNSAGQDILNKRKAVKGLRGDASAYENRNAKAPANASSWAKANAFQKRARAKGRIAAKSFRQGSFGVGATSSFINDQVADDVKARAGKLGEVLLENSGAAAPDSTLYETDDKGNIQYKKDADGNNVPKILDSLQDAQKHMANGGSFMAVNRDGKKTVFSQKKTDPILMSAMINKAAKDGNVEAVRTAIENGKKSNATPEQIALKSAFERAMTSNPEKLMAAAPDLYKGADGAFKSFKGKDVAGWDKTTLDRALKFISGPVTAEYTPAKKKEAWATFSAALETIATSPELRASFGPGQIKQIWETVNVGKLKPDGTVEVPPTGMPSLGDLDGDNALLARAQQAIGLIGSDGTLGRMGPPVNGNTPQADGGQLPPPVAGTQQPAPQADGGQLPPPVAGTQQPAPTTRLVGIGSLLTNRVPRALIDRKVAELAQANQLDPQELRRKLDERISTDLVPSTYLRSLEQEFDWAIGAYSSVPGFPDNPNSPEWNDQPSQNPEENARRHAIQTTLEDIIRFMLSD